MVVIGFIGIGIMGKGMLKNLLTKVDATFVIWNRYAMYCRCRQQPHRFTQCMQEWRSLR
jgi:3-hydroxyisobutyrate dehydrogenase-like beta-hydroxyacid dehydrogenase